MVSLKNISFVFVVMLLIITNSLPDTNVAVGYDLTSAADDLGAVCLDGSVPRYYLRPATSSLAKTKWLIFLEGGSWCVGDQDPIPETVGLDPACGQFPCYIRSQTDLGSSIDYPDELDLGVNPVPYLQTNCEFNPTFCEWNLVTLKYCDGGIYSSNRDDPIPIFDDDNNIIDYIFYRGKRILFGYLDDMLQDKGLTDATEIVFAGTSAGGFALTFNIDRMVHYVQKRSNLQKYQIVFAGIIDHGIFLADTDTDLQTVFDWVIDNQQIEKQFDDDCRKAFGYNDITKCMSGDVALKFVQTPLLIYQSRYDSYVIQCILGITDPPDIIDANADHVKRINENGNAYDNALVDIFESLNNRINHFLFIDSCDHHSFIQKIGNDNFFQFIPFWNIIFIRSDDDMDDMDDIRVNGAEGFDFWYIDDQLQETIILNQTSTNDAYPCHECCQFDYIEPIKPDNEQPDAEQEQEHKCCDGFSCYPKIGHQDTPDVTVATEGLKRKECCKACNDDDKCRSWTFDKRYGGCWLFYNDLDITQEEHCKECFTAQREY